MQASKDWHRSFRILQKEKDSLVKTSDGFVYRDTEPGACRLFENAPDARFCAWFCGLAPWEMVHDHRQVHDERWRASFPLKRLLDRCGFSPVATVPRSSPDPSSLSWGFRDRRVFRCGRCRRDPLNPIVRSFLISMDLQRSGAGCKVLVSASGRGMLSGIRRSFSAWMLEGRLPVEEFLMHETVLGTDGSSMSKHMFQTRFHRVRLSRVAGASAARFVLHHRRTFSDARGLEH